MGIKGTCVTEAIKGQIEPYRPMKSQELFMQGYQTPAFKPTQLSLSSGRQIRFHVLSDLIIFCS